MIYVVNQMADEMAVLSLYVMRVTRANCLECEGIHLITFDGQFEIFLIFNNSIIIYHQTKMSHGC